MLEDSREELRELPREELKGHHEERPDDDLSLSSSRGIMFEAFSSASFVDDDDDGSFGSLATGVSSLESFAKSEAAFGSDMVERTRRTLSVASAKRTSSTYKFYKSSISISSGERANASLSLVPNQSIVYFCYVYLVIHGVTLLVRGVHSNRMTFDATPKTIHRNRALGRVPE